MDLEDQFAEFLNMMRDIVEEEEDLEEVAAQWWRSKIDVKATQISLSRSVRIAFD